MNSRITWLSFMVIICNGIRCDEWNPFSEQLDYLEFDDVPHYFERSVRAAGECKVYNLKITDCDLKVTRLGKQRIGAEYEKTCNLKEASFQFTFGMQDKYSVSIKKQKPELIVTEMKKEMDKEKKHLMSGTHTIYVEMKATSLKNVEMTLRSKTCTFFVIHEDPFSYCGRINRNVLNDVSFKVDASKSRNNDLGNTNSGLEFRWNCTDTVGFCEGRNLGTGKTVTVDKKYAKLDAKFAFTLEVRTAYSQWQKSLQYIHVNPTRPYVINCISRCGKDPNKWNPLNGVMILAECQFHCNKYDHRKVGGVVSYVNRKDREILVARIAEGPKVIPTIVADRKLKAIAFYDNDRNNILAEQEFSTYPVPKFGGCKAIPPKGNPLTKFKMNCKYDENIAKNFEIEVQSGKTVVFSTTSEILEDIEFVVPKNSTVAVKLRDINELVVTQKVKVKIEPLVKDTKNVSKVNEHLVDVMEGRREGSLNVDNLIADGNHSKAVQIIDVVARELSNVVANNEEDKKTISNLRQKLLRSLSDLNIDNVDMSKSVSGVISLIANQHRDNVSEADMAKQLSELCSKVAKKQLYLMENDVAGKIQEEDVKSIVNNLVSCGESEMAPYYEMFDDISAKIEITTHYPLKDDLSENNVEDYPEYIADDLIENQMQNFLVAAENVMNICRDMGTSLILVASIYNELPTYIERSDTVVAVYRATGENMAGAQFYMHNVSVEVSNFLKSKDSTFSIQICTFRNDPFWSASKTFRICTNVVDLAVTDMAEEVEIKNFGTKPMNISFGVKDNQQQKVIKSVNFSNGNTSEFPEDNFIIFIMQTKGMEAFFIDFYDLDENDNINMVLTEMERPLLHHFSMPYSITKANSRLFFENQVDEDKWFLLGIMDEWNRNIKGNASNLKFSVYTARCVRWNFDNSSWKSACKVDITTTTEKIHCLCFNLSTLAGSLSYNDIRQHPKYIGIDFVLEDRKSLHICITVCITVGLYFFLLVYSIHKRETKEDVVYFLSDVPSQNRYGYLISIQTGKRLDAGTTSDIMIQIFGSRANSQEHVLNFPDPFLELLQRNQKDMFVLGTSKYLGRLLKINLWFDCTGISPNWYCDEVRIFDLQSRKWSLFKVKKWLRVDGNPRLLLEVAAVAQKSRSNQQYMKNSLFRIFSSFGQLKNTVWSVTTHTDNPNFGLPKRITLILSIILTLMVILLLFYGKPEMIPRDTITPTCDYEFNWNTVYIAMYSAVMTFFPHTVLIQGFKKSRIQYETSDNNKFPFGATIFFWIILIIHIFIQIHVLLFYGYWVIYPTSWQWTASLLIALLFYIFILEYIFQIFLISTGAVIKNGKMNYDKILRNVESQRDYLYTYFGKNICRPILTPLYEVMDKAVYLKKYLLFRQKRRVIWQIQDLTMISSFIFFLYVIILEQKDPTLDVLAYNEALYLLKGYENTKMTLSRVSEIDEFEDFMEGTFIPNLQSYQWYGRYLSESPGLTSDACNRYLGIIRIRQHRAELTSCNSTNLMEFLNRPCTSTNYLTHFDYLNYTPAWTETIPEFHRTRLGYVWGHQDATGETLFGVSGHYKKGGYIALLGRTMKNSIVNFEYLRRYGWMNFLTRAIFIEFPLYNVNTNLFNFATVILERTSAGYIYKKAYVKSVRIVSEGSRGTVVSLICSILFMGVVFLITVRTIRRIIKTKVWYKRDLWHLVDLGIISLSITWIVMYFRRLAFLKNFVKELEEKRSNSFVDYFDLIGVESWLQILASTLICVITVRIWGLLRFANVFRIVERTLSFSVEPLIYCFVYFLIICIAFGVMGFVLFCTTSFHFKDSFSTAKSLILMAIGLRGPKTLHLDESDSSLGYAFIVLFYMFSYFLTTIFIAIIIVNFLKAQEFAFEETLEYNMKDFTRDNMKNLKRLAQMWVRKFRLKAGATKNKDEEMVTPKSNDIRYLNCVSVDSNRMKAMASVANCVLLKRKKRLMIDETDHAIMMRTVRDLCRRKSGEDEFFFKQDTKSEGCRFVDNRRLLIIEKIVKRMVESPEKRATRLKKEQEDEFLRSEITAKLEMMNYRLKTMLKVVEEISVEVASR